MLCAKCNQKEATIHFRTVEDDANGETIHLCKECAPYTGFDLDKQDLKQIEALSIVGKKCEFCGREASSGQMSSKEGAVYWCFDCGLEFVRILGDLLVAERPDLLQRSKAESSFLSFCCDPGIQAWSEAASRKAVQTLKERRRQDGRDKGS
jgi:hypothetical protein